MRTERRQELRTNELSQQIAQVGQYVKKHAIRIVVIAVVVVGGGVGGYSFVHGRSQRLEEGWATLSRTSTLVSAGSPISVFEEVARQDLQDGLTAEAWLKVGDVALSNLLDPAPVADNGAQDTATDATDWAAKAESGYTQVVTRFPNDVTASGKAMILLGVLAEIQDDTEQARQWYQEVVDAERFAGTPFHEQASYRLANLERWSEPVVFAPPRVTVPAPPSTGDAAKATLGDALGEEEELQQSLEKPAAVEPRTDTTGQPATATPGAGPAPAAPPPASTSKEPPTPAAGLVPAARSGRPAGDPKPPKAAKPTRGPAGDPTQGR